MACGQGQTPCGEPGNGTRPPLTVGVEVSTPQQATPSQSSLCSVCAYAFEDFQDVQLNFTCSSFFAAGVSKVEVVCCLLPSSWCEEIFG